MKRRSERAGEAPAGCQPDQGIAASGGQAASTQAALQPATRRLLDYLQKLKIKSLLLDLFILYVSVPFVIRLFPSLLGKFVYLNFLSYPFGVDFQKPEVYIHNYTTNFYLTSEPGVTFGIWHALPDNRREEAEGKDRSWYEEALADDNPVIIYLHGNGGNRATKHRVQFTKAMLISPPGLFFRNTTEHHEKNAEDSNVVQNLHEKKLSSAGFSRCSAAFWRKAMSDAGFHILAVDYRGFADSTGQPSEAGFTTDVLHIYRWVKARSRNSTVIFWGHSLGTGISTNVARELEEKEGIIVDAVVLEAPYTNIRDAAATIPVTKIYRKFPGFEYLILDTMALAGMYFSSDRNVQVLSSPILILHSEDDAMIPISQGRKLFEIAHNSSQKKENVKFISFPASKGFGHDYISFNPELPAIVKDFLKSVK